MTSCIPICIPRQIGTIFGIHGIAWTLESCTRAPYASPKPKTKNASPKDKDYVLGDGVGLHMRVRSNGSRLWNFNYIHPVTSKRLNMGLGAYPETSLAQARKLTIDARQQIAQGLDPKEQRDNARQQLRATSEHTLRKVAEAWFDLKKEGVTQAYAEDIWRSLTLHVFPDLGHLQISSITALK